MDIPHRSSTAFQFIVALAAIIIVIAGMRAADALLVNFFLAVFLAILFSIPIYRLSRLGLPTYLSVTVVVVAVLGLGTLVTFYIGDALSGFYQRLPGYQAIFNEKVKGLTFWLQGYGIHPAQLREIDLFDSKSVMRVISSIASGLSRLLANTTVIMLTVIFILLEAAGMPRKLSQAFDIPVQELDGMNRFVTGVRRYLGIKTWTSLLTGLLVWMLLRFMAVQEALLWGFIAFLLNYVPTIGSVIASVPGIFLALIQYDLATALWVSAGYMAINFGVSNFIEPRVMGRELGLSTLVVFLSLVFWGWVLGPIGMLLSVPLTMIVKIGLESHPDTRWIAILLGPAPRTTSAPSGGEPALQAGSGSHPDGGGVPAGSEE